MDFFKHDLRASEDEKLCDLLASGGYEYLGYYWRFVEYLYNNGGKIKKKSIAGVAWVLHMDADVLSNVISGFDLFKEDDLYIYSERILAEIQGFEELGRKMSENGKKSAEKRAKATSVEQPLNERSTTVEPPLNNKIKENKIKEKKIKEREKTRARGKHENVFLSEEEYATLKEQFPKDADEKIERLSKYIADTGKNYASHYETLTLWIKQDGVSEPSFEVDEFIANAIKRGEKNAIK